MHFVGSARDVNHDDYFLSQKFYQNLLLINKYWNDIIIHVASKQRSVEKEMLI